MNNPIDPLAADPATAGQNPNGQPPEPTHDWGHAPADAPEEPRPDETGADQTEAGAG